MGNPDVGQPAGTREPFRLTTEQCRDCFGTGEADTMWADDTNKWPFCPTCWGVGEIDVQR